MEKKRTAPEAAASTTTTDTAATNTDAMSLGPIFAIARAGFDQYRVQADRWMEYGAAQVAETFRAAQGAHVQMMAASAAALEAIEAAGQHAAASMSGVASSFGGSNGRSA